MVGQIPPNSYTMALDSLDIVGPGAIFQSERQAKTLPAAAAKQLPPAWEKNSELHQLDGKLHHLSHLTLW